MLTLAPLDQTAQHLDDAARLRWLPQQPATRPIQLEIDAVWIACIDQERDSLLKQTAGESSCIPVADAKVKDHCVTARRFDNVLGLVQIGDGTGSLGSGITQGRQEIE